MPVMPVPLGALTFQAFEGCIISKSAGSHATLNSQRVLILLVDLRSDCLHFEAARYVSRYMILPNELRDGGQLDI